MKHQDKSIFLSDRKSSKSQSGLQSVATNQSKLRKTEQAKSLEEAKRKLASLNKFAQEAEGKALRHLLAEAQEELKLTSAQKSCGGEPGLELVLLDRQLVFGRAGFRIRTERDIRSNFVAIKRLISGDIESDCSVSRRVAEFDLVQLFPDIQCFNPQDIISKLREELRIRLSVSS